MRSVLRSAFIFKAFGINPKSPVVYPMKHFDPWPPTPGRRHAWPHGGAGAARWGDHTVTKSECVTRGQIALSASLRAMGGATYTLAHVAKHNADDLLQATGGFIVRHGVGTGSSMAGLMGCDK